MNIFFLDHEVEKCAKFHNDRHVVKMITELNQILSTAHRVLDGISVIGQSKSGRKQTQWEIQSDAIRETTLYKATHVNHPSAIWARANKENYIWASNLSIALAKEYAHRYGKLHKAEWSGLSSLLTRLTNTIETGEFFEPPLCMPEEYHVGSTVESYRNYYKIGKAHLGQWKNREIPDWFLQ